MVFKFILVQQETFDQQKFKQNNWTFDRIQL